MLHPTYPARLRALAIAAVCLWLGAAPAALAQQPAAPAADEPAAVEVSPVPQAHEAQPASSNPQPAPGGMPLPHDLSPWGMFAAANIVVQAVMVGLAFASVVTWTIGLAKALELAFARRRLRRALRTLFASAELSAPAGLKGPAAAMVQAADLERTRSAGLPAEGIKERVAASLVRIEAGFGRRITRGTGLLATIGATAPFVGLFGTVWGIMNAFIGISKAQTTNLAVVAPGIAEALLATAIGLVAAIPAVIIYNHFARAVSGYRALLGDAAAETLRLLSRDLDRRDAGLLAAPAAPARPRRVPAAAE